MAVRFIPRVARLCELSDNTNFLIALGTSPLDPSKIHEIVFHRLPISKQQDEALILEEFAAKRLQNSEPTLIRLADIEISMNI